jgi:hypothetical protein
MANCETIKSELSLAIKRSDPQRQGDGENRKSHNGTGMARPTNWQSRGPHIWARTLLVASPEGGNIAAHGRQQALSGKGSTIGHTEHPKQAIKALQLLKPGISVDPATRIRAELS